jgi:hypothetical protein
MSFRPIPDPGVLKQADAFREAAQMIDACTESMMSVPTVVNAVFSLELYLKSLNIKWQIADPNTLGEKKAWLKSRTALKTGHDPSKLFGALDISIRNELEQAYRGSAQGHNGQALEDSLKAYDGVFQDWRYIFEGKCKTVDLLHLFSLLEFLSKELNKLPQRWA